jgi:ABC-type Fe3+-hydroxamate transport system substrate-binding protein
MILTSPDQLSHQPKRIVSLVPSQTELLHYLGLETETIAITKFCVHPETWFRNKERVGGTKTIDIEKIRSLNPDLVIANKEENIKEQVEKIAEEFPVWLTDVNDLTGAYEMINDIGMLTMKVKEASELIDRIRNKFNSFFQVFDTTDRIPVAYLIWKDPFMTIGGDTFISNMLENTGFINIFSDEKRYPQINISQLNSLNCKLVFLSSEPYPFKQKDIDELQSGLPGVKIMLVDGEMFSWYGSRLLKAVDYFTFLRQNL